MATFVSQSWLIQRIPSPTIVQVSTVGTRPVSSTVSPARRCHHTSPSRSGTEVRGRTTRAKNATTATALIGSRSFTSAKGIAAGAPPVAGTFGRSRREGQPLDSPAMSRLRRLPSPTVVLVAAAGLVLLAVVIGRGINDPDYFWHVTVGRLITTSGVPSVDPFSFTWFGQPWTPHEWLGEVLMAVTQDAVGPMGVLVAFGLLGLVTLGFVALMLRRHGARTLAVAVPVILAAGILASYLTVRPQALSWALLAALVAWLDALRAERSRWALVLPLLFVGWANLHGLWVVGLGVLGIYTVFTLAGRTAMAAARGRMLVAFVLSAFATMLTPAGPAGILYPLRYVDAGDWGLANIQEWQSPNFHDPAHWAFLLLIVALMANGGRRAPGWLVFLSWVGVVAGLVSLRNVPLAAILAAPALGIGIESRFSGPPPSLDADRTRATADGDRRRRARRDRGVCRPVARPEARDPRGWLSGGCHQRAGHHDAARPPSRRVRLGRLRDQPPLLDRRPGLRRWRTTYDERILEDYSHIRGADPGWQSLAARYGVEAMLFPPGAPITKGPATDAGWCESYRNDAEVLLVPCP